MEILLLVNPAKGKFVKDAIVSVDKNLIAKQPSRRAYLSGQEYVEMALTLKNNLDAMSVLFGYLIAKNVTIRLDVRGIRQTVKNFKDAAKVLVQLRKLVKLGE